jgi:hypothetical protein
MNPSADPAEALDSEKLAAVLTTVHAQVVTALWLSAGMILVFATIVCLALAWRRAALVFAFGYSATLCFLSNGYAQYLGPAGCAVALTGFLWPRRRAAGEGRTPLP